MNIKNPAIKQLLKLYQPISLLNKINNLLDWDMNVNLPDKAGEARGEQISYISDLITQKWLDPELLNLLTKLNRQVSSLNPTEQAILRNVSQAAKFYIKVPKDIILERAKISTQGFMAWQQAKRNNDFKSFQPFLERIIELNRQIAQHLGFKDHPYDALLDLYEPELTTAFCQQMFTPLQEILSELIKKIQSSSIYANQRKLQGHYPIVKQRELANQLLNQMGFDFSSGRIDTSMHPFESSLDLKDVRITTAFHEDDFRSSFSSTMHEGGHALYEQNINPKFNSTPLEGGVSYAIHESQSRFWENIIGKSPQFLEFMTPRLKKLFPSLNKATADEIIRVFNHVQPGLIRIEADEVTYCLHIILRFEIEEGLINGKIKVKDLPEIWQEKSYKYLGVKPKTDSEGVLQDVHWSIGSLGYFPSYALGNLYAAQFAATLKKELSLGQLLSKGNLKPVLAWLKTQIYQYGSLYYPKDIVKRVTQEELNPQFYLDYLNRKYASLYKF